MLLNVEPGRDSSLGLKLTSQNVRDLSKEDKEKLLGIWAGTRVLCVLSKNQPEDICQWDKNWGGLAQKTRCVLTLQ